MTATTARAERTADPAARVAKVGYLGLRTPDLDRMIGYYTEVLDLAVVDRSADHAFLTTGTDHHCVLLERVGREDARAGRTVVGYELHDDLADARRRLTERGIAVERRTDIGPGVSEALVVAEPGSDTPLHLYAAQGPSGIDESGPLRPTKLGHIAAWTQELSRLQSFYEDMLGFRWSDTIGDFFVFLRCNADHHAANFMANPHQQGLHHLAYETRDLDHLTSLLDNLARHSYRLTWGPGRHGPGHNVFTYHHDPDGNEVELFTQLDQIHDEEAGYFEPRPWHEDFPQYPKTWEADLIALAMNKWGPMPPGGLPGPGPDGAR